MSMEINIRKKLGKFNLDMQFATEKSCLGILGASGSGKSMTLKCIAGIVTPDEGRITVNGRVLYDSDRKINIRPQKRKVGYLFQDYALFPVYTTYENIGSGLGKMPAARKKEIIDGLLEQFHLKGLQNHYPHQLSGGQQQRVALARIVACEPEVILLDEPFSALDSHLRLQMQLEIKEILKNYENAVMVTHNRDEAYKLCSDLMIIDEGGVAEVGETQQLFANPRHMKSAELTGCKNISAIRRISDYELCALDWGGLILRTIKPVGDTVRYVGIHSNELMPVFENIGGMDNIIRLSVTDESATHFEKQIAFKNADSENHAQQAELFWEFAKRSVPTTPEYLRMPPERLLLLEGD